MKFLRMAVMSCAILTAAAMESGASAPTSVEVLTIVFQNQNLLLSINSSCKGVGSRFSDKTVGEYLAGVISYQEKSGLNWVEAVCRPVESSVKESWQCEALWARKAGEEQWRWGVRFSLNSKRELIRESFECVGGG